MKRIILAALLGVLVSGPALGKTFVSYADADCAGFTELYAKGGLKWDANSLPTWTNRQFGYRLTWIFGYISAVNNEAISSGDLAKDKGMKLSGVISWIGSWCRDHQSKDLSDAIDAPIEK